MQSNNHLHKKEEPKIFESTKHGNPIYRPSIMGNLAQRTDQIKPKFNGDTFLPTFPFLFIIVPRMPLAWPFSFFIFLNDNGFALDLLATFYYNNQNFYTLSNGIFLVGFIPFKGRIN